MFKNYMEQLVLDQMERLLFQDEQFGEEVCRCERCLAEMRVFALNHLAPVYGTKDRFPPDFTAKEADYRLQAAQAVEQAIAQVSKTAHPGNTQPKAIQSLAGLYRRRDK